jgi:hypothetical protein
VLAAVQNTGFAHGNSVLAAAFPVAITNGNSVVVAVCATAAAVVTVTDDKANVYTQVATETGGAAGAGSAWVFLCSNITNGAKTLSVTGSTILGVWAVEINAKLATDQTAAANGGVGAVDPGAVVTVHANEYIIACIGSGYSFVLVPPAGWTTEAHDTGILSWLNQVADNLLTSAGAVDPAFTGAAVGGWNGVVATFFADAAPAAPLGGARDPEEDW